MNQNHYIIGIDGGGTKTIAVLCTPDTKILAEAQAGPSNFQIIGKEKASNIIIDLIQTCCNNIRCSFSQIGAVGVGLAGAGRVDNQQEITEEIIRTARKRGIEINKLIVDSDARIALEGAFSGNAGIIIIGGTGSIVFARDEKGKTYRAGGWGRLIIDEGSGYAIGQKAFKAVARFLDGYKQKTKLVKIFSDRLIFTSQDDIIKALYMDNFDIASVAPLVIEAAEKGDKISKNILLNACKEITNLVDIVIARMNKGQRKKSIYPLSLTGSLFENENLYVRMVKSRLRRNTSKINICDPQYPPVIGAVLMAINFLKESIER